MFQDRLYQLRKGAGISQEELADVIGVSRQAVQKWESGASRPDMDNLVALSRYFHVTLDYLIAGTEGPEPARPEEEPAPARSGHFRWGYVPWEYEYKSRRTLWGLPLVHIHVSHRGFTWARGIIAVGNVATGLIACGGLSAGALSLGGFSLGLLALGGIAAGALAIGGLVFGLAALGGVAFGLLSIGGVAVGQYAAGGAVLGSVMAVGGAASAGQVAIGVAASPDALLSISLSELYRSGVAASQLAEAVAALLPDTPMWIIRLLLLFGL